MKYVALIYTDPTEWDGVPQDQVEKIYQEYAAISQEPVVTGGAQLQPADTTTAVRVRDGKTMTTDGPFAETKEQLGGYYLIEVDSVDEAIEWAAKIPSAQLGSIEVRPVVPSRVEASAG